MLIFGRSPNLLLSLLAAAFNLLVVFELGGFRPTVEQIAQVNTFLFAFVAFVANSDTIVIAAGNEAHRRRRTAAAETTRSAELEATPPPADPPA